MRPPAAAARRGFSLIEIMFAVTVIAILCATALQNYVGLVDEARQAADLHREGVYSRDQAIFERLGKCERALEQYHLATGAWPGSLSALVPSYLDNYYPEWRGDTGSGRFDYDPSTGRVTLRCDSADPKIRRHYEEDWH